jgi:hypothetical protein
MLLDKHVDNLLIELFDFINLFGVGDGVELFLILSFSIQLFYFILSLYLIVLFIVSLIFILVLLLSSVLFFNLILFVLSLSLFEFFSENIGFYSLL